MVSNVVEGLRGARLLCIGCRACANACEQNAITLHPDEEGFFRSRVFSHLCVECGRCSAVCPQLRRSYGHKTAVYAMRADSESVKASSSGAVFTLLARWAFERGGCICGAIMGPDMKTKYAIAESLDEIQPMRGIKNTYSDMGFIYKSVRARLNQGKDVVFVGLPCHVQAVKNYIGDNSRLWTVDIACNGQPSPLIFEKYLAELSNGKTISSIVFRPKGETPDTLSVTYDDGSTKVSNKDPYLRALDSRLLINQACSRCQFVKLPRTGNITIGDYAKGNPKEGQNTNVVIVNDDRGASLLSDIMDISEYMSPVQISALDKNSGFQESRDLNLGWIRLFHMVARGHSVSKSVRYCLGWKFDVGITGFWRVMNYGGELTYYALYHIFQDMGLESILIDYRSNTEGAPQSPPLLKTQYPFYSIARWYKTKKEQEELNSRVTTFVVGSDQVWNRRFVDQDTLECYALDFVHDDRNKVSVAASFGTDRFEGSEAERESFARLVRRFNHLSVREKSAVDICRDMGAEATILMDPVMLCDIRHFEALAEASTARYPERYVFNYMMFAVNFIGMEAIYKKLGYGPITVGNANANLEDKIEYPRTNAGSLENWMKCIKGSSFVVTDSFHGTVFSILFKKQFITLIGNWGENSGVGRITTLLGMLGLESRIFKTPKEAVESGVMDDIIDYDEVYEKLDANREESMKWLRNAILGGSD
ncbi:MAG: 4Fe-4S dicluster domain-containing protein [Thermoplasmata archaeon]|jgi:coenzyme F420-reducing hydrogenase beta subunit|nr:4Fe-4S dicluster domain-containing protein [Thermoplasmata archaeon]